MKKRLTKAERAQIIARNTKRLDEVNEFLRTVDLDLWDVKDAASISGYIVGVWMVYKPDKHTLFAQNETQVRLIEHGWRGPVWPSDEEARVFLAGPSIQRESEVTA